MGDFSGGQAIGAGFRLIGRAPLAFLAWTLAYMVLGMAPQVAFFAAVLPQWSQMMQAVAANAGAHAPAASAEMFRAQAGMMQLQPLLWISGLISHTLVLSAIFRAVLHPQDQGFFYLRLGVRELWMGLSLLVLFVVAFLLMFAAMIPALILSVVTTTLVHDQAVAPLMTFSIVVVAAGVVIWVLLRLSMAPPLSFAQNGFRLYESWDLTRGQAGKMFLVALALAVIVLIAEIVIGGVLLALGGFSNLERLAAWMEHPQFDWTRLAPWIAGAAIVAGLLSTVLNVLFGAAWAEIYRELTEDVAPEAAGS